MPRLPVPPSSAPRAPTSPLPLLALAGSSLPISSLTAGLVSVCSRLAPLLSAAFLSVALGGALWLAPAAAETPADRSDLRSTVFLDFDCANELGRRQITLFANGTVRLREGPPGEETMRLAELGPDELAAVVRRLGGEDLGETEADLGVVGGDWVEQCRLQLLLPDHPARIFTFDRYSSLSLALSRVVAIGRELGERVEEENLSDRHLPAGFTPRTGDVLERLDGALYQVTGMTADGKGVELQGVNQPFTLFVRLEDLPREFVAVTSRRGGE